MADQLVGSSQGRWIRDAQQTGFAIGRPRSEAAAYSYSEGGYKYEPALLSPNPHSIPPSPTIKIEYSSPHCACAR